MRQAYLRAGAIAVVGIVAFVGFALPAMFGYVPQPAVHDDFAYLLQADTFVHARLANKPHEHWPFFETFHVIQQPTYAAKFPPGQGLALALGQLIWRPIVGAWITGAIGCAAVTWMLMAVMPWQWALVAGLLAAGSPHTQWWGQIHWGGGVAMGGGALLCGACLWMMRRGHLLAHSRDATRRASLSDARRVASRLPGRERNSLIKLGLVAGIGLAILANSRPFEGLILAFLLAGLVLFHAFRRGKMFVLLKYVTPGVAVVMIPAAGWMAYYNWRVTGNALLMPYKLHEQQYMVAPLMHWQDRRPEPKYNHDIMREFYAVSEPLEYDKGSTWAGMWETLRTYFWMNYLLVNLVGVAPLVLGLAVVVWSRWARWAVIVWVGMLVIHFACAPWLRGQYLAPIVGFFFGLMAMGLHWLSLLRWRWWQAAIAIAVMVIVAGMRIDTIANFRFHTIVAALSVNKGVWLLLGVWLGVAVIAALIGVFLDRRMMVMGAAWWKVLQRRWRPGLVVAGLLIVWQLYIGAKWAYDTRGAWSLGIGTARADFVEKLRKQPVSKWLVFVRYGPEHKPQQEFVYNLADIDAQDVVFAREMGGLKNVELMGYYRNRGVLLLEPDQGTIRVLRGEPGPAVQGRGP